MPVIGHIHHNTIFKERQTTVITVATSIWGVGTARGSVAPGFSAPSSTEASMRLIHRPQSKVGCVYTQVTIKLSLSWVIWATHSLSHEMLLWGTLETWKPVCVWKKPSQTLINNLNGIHPFSKLKPGSWNCSESSLDCIKSSLCLCISYSLFHLDGAFSSQVSWLEQPVGTWFCEWHGDRGRLKVKEMVHVSLSQKPGPSPPETWWELHEVLQLIPSVQPGPFVKMEHKGNVLKLKGPAWGSKEETVLFYQKKKKKRKKGKEKQFRMVVEIKKKGQQNYPVQLTFRFSIFFFFYCFLCRRYLFSVCISISGVSQMGSDFHMLSTQIWSTFLWWSPVFWVKYHSW